MSSSLGNAKSSARAELLQKALSQKLGEPVVCHIAKTYDELQKRVSEQQADIVWAPAGILAELETKTSRIFKVVRAGHAAYCSAIIAKKDGRFDLNSLNGKRAVWVDPKSLGGYLLAVDHLRRRGIEPDRTFSSQKFVGSHPAAAAAVLHGEADVAAVTSTGQTEQLLREMLTLYVGPAQNLLASIAMTALAPTDGVALLNHLTPGTQERISSLFLPDAKPGKAPSFVYTAMDADGFEEAAPGEYGRLRSLLSSENTHAIRSVSKVVLGAK
jgi:ABC-type phosphate/phosphonate transport system substrate-binding protein